MPVIKFKVKDKGFTLIELLVVIAILGILATIGLVAFSGVQASARDTKRKADIDAIAKALEAKYNIGTGLYPDELVASDFTSGSKPKTPEGGDYYFQRSSDGKAFIVCASTLEKAAQPYCKYSVYGSSASIADLVVPTPTPSRSPIPSPSPSPIPTPSPSPIARGFKYVFATSQTYNGNLGGLAGADNKCQTLADAAGIGNTIGATYKAWLSDSTTSAASRLTHADVPYQLVGGTTIANNWADLTDGSIGAKISKSEAETSVYGDYRRWTKTNSDGSIASGDSCANWFSDSGAVVSGMYPYTDSRWTSMSSLNCVNTVGLYCFEQ